MARNRGFLSLSPARDFDCCPNSVIRNRATEEGGRVKKKIEGKAEGRRGECLYIVAGSRKVVDLACVYY